MLEKPAVPDQLIIDFVEGEYNLRAHTLEFLPLGADVNTAVYRLVTQDERDYFLKLRKGGFDPITVRLPQYLHAQGIKAVIAPLETANRSGWALLKPYVMILYPYIDGKNGYQVGLSDSQWLEFGSALKSIHSSHVPEALAQGFPSETYSPRWRKLVSRFQVQVEQDSFTDPVAAQLAMFMKSKKGEISRLVRRAGELAGVLKVRSLPVVLCHSDIHAGNLLVAADGALYIVDWDNPCLAPRERDLLLVGGCDLWNNERQKALFYQGYGEMKLDGTALAYYRHERIIQDIAEFCKQLLWSQDGGMDREQSLEYFTGQFLPGHEVDLAFESDRSLGD